MAQPTAKYYHQLHDGKVQCQLCPHHCLLANGKTGLCRSRRNSNGTLVSEVYGKPCSLAIDPIEKKPLYHFHPGTKCLSLACTGCNFHCANCQNHDISQAAPWEVDFYDLSPQQVVDAINEAREEALRTGKKDGSYYVGHGGGLRINLYLDNSKKVVTAFPIINGK